MKLTLQKLKQGEDNVNSLLTNQDVYEIREEYKKLRDLKLVYERYKDRIAFPTFENIWRGNTWKSIHMDVYSKELQNKRKQLGNLRVKYNSKKYKITRDCVIPIRKMYAQEKLTADQVYHKFDFLNRNTFNDIWYGHTFLDLMPQKYIEVKKRGRKHYKTILKEEKLNGTNNI